MTGRERLLPVCRTSTSLCRAPPAGFAGLRGQRYALSRFAFRMDAQVPRSTGMCESSLQESLPNARPRNTSESGGRALASTPYERSIYLDWEKMVGRERFERSTT